MVDQQLLDSFVEIEPLNEDEFLKVRETLTRIGMVASDNTLWQSCHVFHKAGKYYIVHYKELLLLDGHKPDFDENDIARRNTICKIISKWGLVKVIDEGKIDKPTTKDRSKIKILTHAEKSKWKLGVKYTIGK